jgi:hypothetical protein
MYLRPIGDTPTAPATQSFNLHDAVSSDTVKTASALALTYHGYRRTGSILWALFYGAMGRWIPAVAVPVALAQGFGEKKPCP